MADQQTSKGPWTHRFLVYLFTVGLTVLIFWLLGFVINDIGSWPGPDYSEVEQRLLDPKLLGQEKALTEQIAETEREKENQQARQAVLRDSTSESQRTMSQLLEFQRLNLEKDITPSEAEQQALAESQQLFLKNQKQYQLLNEEIARLDERLRDLQQQQRDNAKELDAARRPVTQEFEKLSRRHDLKMAALKLTVLLPLLVAAVVLFLKMRTALYAPLVYAFGIAVLLKVGLVMHEYFPTRYFKYVLILAALIIVGRILVSLLRMVAFPKREWLLKQYREAYERFLLPGLRVSDSAGAVEVPVLEPPQHQEALDPARHHRGTGQTLHVPDVRDQIARRVRVVSRHPAFTAPSLRNVRQRKAGDASGKGSRSRTAVMSIQSRSGTCSIYPSSTATASISTSKPGTANSVTPTAVAAG